MEKNTDDEEPSSGGVQGPSGRTFNVFDDPWIAVLTGDGHHKEVSMAEVFSHPSDYRSLDGELDCQDTAVMRLLLAFLYRVLRPDYDSWEDMWAAGQFPMDRIRAYVDGPAEHDGCTVHDRLWLDDGRMPFLQVTGLHPSSGEDNWRNPSCMVPSIRKFRQLDGQYNSDRIEDTCRTLAPGEALRWLVCSLSYDVAGIHTGMAGDPNESGGKTHPGITTAARSTVMHVEAGNLFRTLMLAMVPLDFEGMSPEVTPPIWELDPFTSRSAGKDELRPVSSVIDEYVFPSRRILMRFNDEGMVDGVMIGAGDRTSTSGSGVKAASSYRPSIDPMVGWVKRIPNKKRPDEWTMSTWKARPGQAIWRGLPSMLRHDGEGSRPLVLSFLDDLNAYGEVDGMTNVVAVTVFYDSKNAVVEDLACDGLRLPTAVMTDDRLADLAIEAVSLADKDEWSWHRYCSEVRMAAGDTTPSSEYSKADDEHYYAMIGPLFDGWSAGLDHDVDSEEAISDWRDGIGYRVLDMADRFASTLPPRVYSGVVADERTYSYGHARNWLVRNLRGVKG